MTIMLVTLLICVMGGWGFYPKKWLWHCREISPFIIYIVLIRELPHDLGFGVLYKCSAPIHLSTSEVLQKQ